VLNVHGVHDVGQLDIHTAEPLVPESSFVEVEIAIGKLKQYKSPGTDQILAESRRWKITFWDTQTYSFYMEQGGIATAVESIYYCTNSWKGDKTNCNNYRGISLLSTAYRILSNILRAMLIPYGNEVIGNHQWGFPFRRNRCITEQIFYIRQMLEKKWDIIIQCISYL
jgi:hypothetical protein